MVSSNTVNSSMEQYNNVLTQYQSTLSNLSSWAGTSREGFDRNVANFLSEYTTTINNQLSDYMQACELLKTYTDNKNNLKTATDNYNAAVANRKPQDANTFAQHISTIDGNIRNIGNQINNLLSSIVGTKLEAQRMGSSGVTASNGTLPNSTVNMLPEVQQFLENNKGKTVEIPKEIRDALGLQCEGLISIPESYDSSKAYPFLLWLVGTGHAAGSVDNLKTASFAKSLVNGNYKNDDAIIYIPTRWGNGDANNSKYNKSKLDNDLDKMINGLNVDRNAISGAGSSVGAFALAYLTTSHPNLFSTVAMTGGGYGGSLNNAYTVDQAISGSPNTTYIWYVADNDESSRESVGGEYVGNGVHTYTLQQHQQLRDNGINSVYYEVQGGIGHSYAVARFPTESLIYDLTHIKKGQKFDNLPEDVQQVTSQESANAAIDGGNGNNTYYVQLAV